MENKNWRPFWKQVFVVLGVSINLAQIGLTTGYAAILLPQLRQPDSLTPIDDDSGSWIASMVGITQILGNILVAPIMGKYGRRVAGLVAASSATIGWIWISLATSITSILIARSLQGIHTGMSGMLTPVATGEYSSPQNRAAFTSLLILILSFALLYIHSFGTYLSWQTTALIAAAVSFIDLLILIYSPESPSWLADQGRYDECTKVFRWLRGENEEEELQKIIEACKLTREVKSSRPSQTVIKDIVTYFRIFCKLLVRREFYLPFHIVGHLYISYSWNGMMLLSSYAKDYYHHIVGPDVDFGMQISLIDITRIIANIFGIYFIKKFRRRVLLGVTGGMNTLFLFVTAIYAYMKLYKLLQFDSPLIGILLAHINVIFIVTGPLILATTISSEVFPLEFRSFASASTSCVNSIATFISLKTIPFTVNAFGMHGLFLIYGIIMSYCLIATLLVLPETKDRTLQDIEDELRGKHRVRQDGTLSAVPLTSLDTNNS